MARPAPWTEEEDAILREMWPDVAIFCSRIAEVIGKTKCSIIGRARRLKLENKRDRNGGRHGPMIKRIEQMKKPRALMISKRPSPLPLPKSVPIFAGSLTLKDLTSDHCHWPLDGGLYCGGIIESRNLRAPMYCQEHTDRALVRRSR